MLFLDLDRFKVVNDSLGHEAGDRLLHAVARRLAEAVRSGDTVARLGGDEFTVLTAAAAGPREAVRLAERIVAALREPFTVEGRQVFAGASVGIAEGEPGQTAPEELLRQADLALYRAKRERRGGWALFDPSLTAEVRRRLELEVALRRAVETGGLALHYQPVIDLRSGRIAGLEALLRWEHPERGPIPPSEFIPLAEETGLMIPLGRQTLLRAGRQLRRWQERGLAAPGTWVSVNLSARELAHPGLVEAVGQALERSGLAPADLALEVTESAALDVDQGAATLRACRELGVTLLLDDFGTGFATLTSLKRFPADVVKVDASFVRGLGADPVDTAIVSAAAALTRDVGVRSLAEGVETEDQLQQVRRLGYDLAQGFRFSPALAPRAAAQLLEAAPAW